MTNNDILRRIRYALDLSDPQAISLFSLDATSSVAMDKSAYLNRISQEQDPQFLVCSDLELAAFLDGLIVSKRGLRENATATAKPADFHLNKNDILKKLRIAMNYKEQDMLDALAKGGSTLSKSELGALFRNPQHKHYRACGNQVLRHFIKGLTSSLRP